MTKPIRNTMSKILWLALLSCGGARQPGEGRPGEVVFWKVETSKVEFGQCTDFDTFRSDVQPVAVSEGTYLAYRIQEDGKSAISVECTRLDASTCSTNASSIVFSIQGREMTYSSTREVEIQNATCKLSVLQSWTFVDGGETFDLKVDEIASYASPTAVCRELEEQIKQNAPNKMGLEGCVISYVFSGRLGRRQM